MIIVHAKQVLKVAIGKILQLFCTARLDYCSHWLRGKVLLLTAGDWGGGECC